MMCFPRQASLILILLSLSASSLHAREVSTNLPFSDDQLSCEIVSTHDSIPEVVLSVLPVAMKTALKQVGAPTEPAQLTIRLQAPLSFFERARSFFRVEASAVQKGDEILLRVGNDPLKLAFRLGHELSHWLVYKRFPARPPLWLDEGLSQLVGAAAADNCARTHKQSLARPRPSKLNNNLFTLDELIALEAYPKTEGRSAAFYWQAEALVQAIHKRLGSAEFAVYLKLLSESNSPDWQVPLRERWYFSDWDFNWLAEQIRPDLKAQ